MLPPLAHGYKLEKEGYRELKDEALFADTEAASLLGVEMATQMEIRFRFNAEKFANAVSYFASKSLPELSKLKIVKLLYFADKLHLQRYGRPITGDQYYKIDLGPIPSRSKGIMDHAENRAARLFHLDPGVRLLLSSVELDTSGKHPIYHARTEPDLDVFSDSDIEVLDDVISQYGQMRSWDLVNLTHKESTCTKTEGKKIDFRLFFEDMEDPVLREARVRLLEFDQGMLESA